MRRIIRDEVEAIGLPGGPGTEFEAFEIGLATITEGELSPFRRLLGDVLERLHSLGWSDDQTFGVHLAAEEALMNAMKHGHQRQGHLIVEVTVSLSAQRFCMVVKDQGEGFDPADIPDPTLAENLELPSGRGLMLMETFMTRRDYNDSGNEVTIERVLGQPTLGELAEAAEPA